MFKNRQEAGKQLAKALGEYKNAPNAIVLALPRGGVVVGYEVAKALNLPLDIVVPRKIGAPENPEYAIGAITETGDVILNEEEVRAVDREWLKQKMEKEKKEAQRRLKAYRAGLPSPGLRPPSPAGRGEGEGTLPNIAGRTVLLVDDGIATGYTMRAAIASVKSRQPAKIIVAAPHGARDSIEQIRKEVDEVIALEIPPIYFAVGAQYEDFPQTSDKEVIELLKDNRAQHESL